MPIAPGRSPLGEKGAVIGAVLGKEAAPGTKIPSKPKDTAEAAQLIRHKLQEKQDPDTILDALRNRTSRDRQPVTRAALEHVVDKNIGTGDRNATGQKTRTGDTLRRYNETISNVQLMDTLLAKGYDQIDPADQPRVLAQVETALRSTDAKVNAFLTGLTAPERQEALERIIKNPEFAKHLQDLVQKHVLSENSIISNKLDGTDGAESKYKKAKIEQDQVDDDLKATETEFRRVDGELQAFDPGDPSISKAPGARFSEVDKTAIAKTNDELRKATGKRQRKESDYTAAREAYKEEIKKSGSASAAAKTLLDRVNRAKDQVVKARKEEEVHTARKQQQEAALAELDQLRAKRRELMRQKAELQLKQLDAEQKTHDAKTELDEAKVDRENDEKTFANNVSRIIGQAAGETFLTLTEQAEEVRQAEREKEKAEAASDEERAIFEAIESRYDNYRTIKPPFGRPRQVRRPNRKQIREDFELVTSATVPGAYSRTEQLIGRMLDKVQVKNAAGVLVSRFSRAQIDAALQNPEFVAKVQTPLLTKLVTERLAVGKMSKSDAEVILKTKWGPDVVNNAIERNTALREKMEELRASGQIPGNVADFLRNTRIGKNLSWIALWLLILPGAAGLVTNTFLE